ncbi:Outer membrane vitamin B12 receptor BtuB [hydrothermal vent metagenome]|uniref:Outer membrane vitamin B12 receptor BtuB n=1 Tax=hydrothermal vent metagenome TaxID=652676 RepID=A0A3B0XD99_9ZZZZ
MYPATPLPPPDQTARAVLRGLQVYKNVRKTILTCSICLSTNISSFNLHAENNELNEVIVTANRYSQTVDDSLSSVTVITRSNIEQSSASDLPSLLSRIPGLDVRTSGAYGKATSIFMRGTNSSHLLTLIDGVKLYSATAGNTSFQHISLDQIERIEIVRGPRSSIYGSEAIGGVIQIFTRKGKQQPSASANIGLGSNNSKEISAGFSGATENASFNLTARGFKTDGIDAIVHTSNNDKDGYNNDSISANFNYHFNQALSLQSSYMNSQGNTEYDSCIDTFSGSFSSSDDCSSEFTQQTFSNTLNITPDGMWDGKFLIGTSRDFNNNDWESTANGRFETNRDDLSFTNNLQLSEERLLVLGVDYSKDTVEASPYPATAAPSRDNFGLFTAWNGAISNHDIEISFRSDDNEQFNRHNTGSISVGHNLSTHSRVFISYGTAFKAPTFNELYFPFFGLETLKPEEADSIEIGLTGKYTSGNWSLNFYQTRIDNLIAYDSNTFLAQNIERAKIKGAELISTILISNWRLNTSLSYTDPVNKSGPNYGKQLQARAKETFSLSANRVLGKHNLGISFLAQSKRYQNAENTASTAGYGIIDLTADYNFNADFKLALKINNILDKEYSLNQAPSGDNYSTLGRNFFINLVYTM